MIRILIGDCVQRMKELPDNSVDSVVCDPPYHLTSIVKRFGSATAAPINNRDERDGRNGPYHRASKGFMGQTWDGGDVAFRPETWAEVLRVLKPGGHLVAFSGTRTYHRMAVAIEDAGFEVRDMIAWHYGSGFPKSHDISKAIDRAAGAEREIVGPGRWNVVKGDNAKQADCLIRPGGKHDETAPATEPAREWEGWGTALKPATEPICLARKPLSEKSIAANVLKWGTGALNIDGCRIETGDDTARKNNVAYGLMHEGRAKQGGKPFEGGGHDLGRWPANLCHDGSDEVVAGFPAEARSAGEYDKAPTGIGYMGGASGGVGAMYADAGSAARFFYCAKATTEERNGGLDSHEIVSIQVEWESADLKATLRVDTDQSPPRVIAVSGVQNKSASEWNTLLFGNESEGRSLLGCKSITRTAISSTTTFRTLNFLARSITNVSIAAANSETVNGGSPAEIVASSTRSITITSAETVFIPGVGPVPSQTPLKISVSEGVSSHPTVKPIALMRWLVRLVTPKGGTCLDPFMGSGSTGLACDAEQFDFIGCEMSPEYAAIAERRIRDAAGMFAQIETDKFEEAA
jgi:DNA modification methylase